MSETDHFAHLKALQLHGMADKFPESTWREMQAEAPRSKTLSIEALLLRLLSGEEADRQVRTLRYQMKAARLPHHRDLAGFDFTETPVDAARIGHLAKGDYLQTAHNLILVGGTGTGKTHIAVALGVAAIHQGKRLRFYNAVDLVNLLEREKAQGRAGSLAKQLVQIDATAAPPRLALRWSEFRQDRIAAPLRRRSRSLH